MIANFEEWPNNYNRISFRVPKSKAPIQENTMSESKSVLLSLDFMQKTPVTAVKESGEVKNFFSVVACAREFKIAKETLVYRILNKILTKDFAVFFTNIGNYSPPYHKTTPSRGFFYIDENNGAGVKAYNSTLTLSKKYQCKNKTIAIWRHCMESGFKFRLKERQK